MTNRRTFIKQAAAAGVVGTFARPLIIPQEPERKMIWANLLHLSYNMWEDNLPEKYRDDNYNCSTCQEAREWAHGYRPDLTFDEVLWQTLLQEMASAGMNMVIIDLGDAVRYESHPEIAVTNAWSPSKLKSELSMMRKMGLEPIPKLNFATTHDIWLGKYSRMVSTDIYYGVCRDLIEEVIELFGRPRFFHLGMDEELASYQKRQDYVVVRQKDLWWGDLYFFIGEVEKRGVRPWVWSDYAWHNPDVFFRKMPKSVLQSNWYYGSSFDLEHPEETVSGINVRRYVQPYIDLDKAGFDQIPTSSNWSNDLNIGGTIDFCRKNISRERLKGFMIAPWYFTLPDWQGKLLDAVDQIAVKK